MDINPEIYIIFVALASAILERLFHVLKRLRKVEERLSAVEASLAEIKQVVYTVLNHIINNDNNDESEKRNR